MNNLHILDCTLRDGGYVNNWSFGLQVISKLVDNITKAKIEMIEAGFLSHTKETDERKSIFNDIKKAERLFSSQTNQTCNLALMINCGEVDADKISPYTGGRIKTIRIAFHKHQRNEAQDLCQNLQSKGYSVFFQPMYTIGYSDSEILELISWANFYKPKAFYIVDSFGTMRKNDLLRIFYLVDHNLNSDIMIGFHSHNNLQLSFSNAQELIILHSKRDIIIDTSVFGMGRGAGNLCTELMTQYINENIEDKYEMLPILEIMDEYIMPIYSKLPWGYSAPYYLAAINNCHPNYATFLMNKESLCIRDISSIIKSIPSDKKHQFSSDLINDLYRNYQEHYVDDSTTIEEISKLCSEKNVLIIAPGKSIRTHKKQISEYINMNHPVIFAINHIPDNFKTDRIFISNLKRFKGIDDVITRTQNKLICTSNVSVNENLSLVNYSSYLCDDDLISDNSGLMLINILKKCAVENLALAGFDGFNINEKSYYSDKIFSNVNAERKNALNLALQNYFDKAKKSIKIKFITPTIYDRKSENE